MDADFSHDPAYLPRLLGAREQADLVIGSRYVPGGGVSDWGPVRQPSAAAEAPMRGPCSASASAT